MPTSDDYVRRLAALFAGLESAHGTHGTPEVDPDRGKWRIKSTARYVREPVTAELWRQHLEGVRPLGVAPIRENSTCSWGCIDLDEYDREWSDVIHRAEKADLPLVPVRSKSGGLHLFVFLTEPAPVADVVNSLREMASRVGFSSNSEIFPTQTTIDVSRGDGAQWVVMPYFGDTYDGRLQPQECLRRTGAAMTVEEFVRHAEGKRVPPSKLTRARRGETRPGGPALTALRGGPYDDGPPCLQHLAADVVEPGGQNTVLFNIALYWKRKDPLNWKAHVESDAQNYFRPVPDSAAIQEVLRSAGKKEYNYQCRVAPLRDFCNRRVCRTRAVGVGQEGDFPSLSGLVFCGTAPPVWFVDVDGTRIMLTTEELMDASKFRHAVANKLQRAYRGLTHPTWNEAVAKAMEGVTHQEVPEEVTEVGVLRDVLEEFLTNRRRGRQKSDLHSGRPWEDVEAGRHYFRLKDFQKFLEQGASRGGKVPSRGVIVALIREEMGGDAHVLSGHDVGMKPVRTFFVPSSSVQAMPEPQVPATVRGEVV